MMHPSTVGASGRADRWHREPQPPRQRRCRAGGEVFGYMTTWVDTHHHRTSSGDNPGSRLPEHLSPTRDRRPAAPQHIGPDIGPRHRPETTHVRSSKRLGHFIDVDRSLLNRESGLRGERCSET